MPARALTDDELMACVRLVEDCLKEGYAPPDQRGHAGKAAITEAATRAVEKKITRTASAFRSRIFDARGRNICPDWSLWVPPQYQQVKTTRRAPTGGRAPMPEDILKPEGPIQRVLAIGDLHDDPRLPDKDRFEWMGRYAKDNKVDRIVQIGDWGTWDSVSRHEDRSTIRGRALPSFEDDLASFSLSLAAFDKGLDGYNCPKHITEGNHEARVQTYENLHPVHEGSMMLRVREAMSRRGWTSTPFGQFYFVEGVGFTHVPLNIMGRPYGGKTLNSMGNDAVHSIVFGHSHKGTFQTFPKIGPSSKIDILNLGCGLPHGHVEDYARLSTTGWHYGVYDLTLQAGQIVSHSHVSMIRLEELYG